jgi:mono/diheme cytochrome c family protein
MRLRRLHEQYSGDGIRLFAVFSNSDETVAGIRAYAEQAEYPFASVRDVGGYLARRLGAKMTPQAFVVDADSVLRYRGAIDDNRYENRVNEQYLNDALASLVAGQDVGTGSTQAMGCSIHDDSAEADLEITYTTHIARLLQDNCQSCHRPGQVAPFALQSFEDAVRWQTEIAAYTHSRLMPPWKASPEVGEFSNQMTLSDAEIDLIQKWVDGGAVEGPAADMPPPPKFNDDWAFGEPDLIVEMPEEYVVGPEGEDDYRHFVIPYEASEHRFVRAVDVRPGNRNVVHHVIGYVDTSGKARELDAADPGPGYTRFGDTGFKAASMIGGWAPGNLPWETPAGSGRWLPQKCDIVLQVHYYRTGVEERDRTKVGIYFSKAPRPVATRTMTVINHDFVLKPNQADCKVEASRVVQNASYLFSITPHMHLLGRKMSVTATLPDGRELPLIRVDDWDFNWQTTYRYKDLHYLPAGTRVDLVARFDNSSENPNNPNRADPQPVRWGEKTTDEMCIAFLGLLPEAEYDPAVDGRRQQVASVSEAGATEAR